MTGKQNKILLVDDNPVAQKMTERLFKGDGYQVFLAWDEKECLEMAKAQKPDAILMDIIFPDGDGREFVRKLRLDPGTKDIPVVFATNAIDVKDDKGNLILIIDEKTYRAFAKPLHYQKVLSTVRKEINRSRNQKKLE